LRRPQPAGYHSRLSCHARPVGLVTVTATGAPFHPRLPASPSILNGVCRESNARVAATSVTHPRSP